MTKPTSKDSTAKDSTATPTHDDAASARLDKDDQNLAPNQGKLLPPESLVNVPNQPRPAETAQEDEAAAQGRARADNQTESNWADGSAPQPRAKNARSHLL
ncbi:hypothetical protein [Bordetella genomosp. 13]|uniref:hypothetical protein n=1 Tax=Bordetella genomosp. 13 TaxID=463040 RepID=UPI0021B6DA89|nr:hypothetical protein [Bordetella genomosp. 13]